MTNVAWLRDNPPKKSEFFTLPDIKWLTDPLPFLPHFAASVSEKQIYLPVKTIFGTLASMDDDSQAAFLMRLISHSEWEPDFQAMADALGVQYGSSIQRRYKALVEKNGFSINVANGIAIKPFDPATDTAAASKSNTASSKSTPNARSGEKRKGRPPKDAEAKSKRAKTKHVPVLEGPAPKVVKRKLVKKSKGAAAKQSVTKTDVAGAEVPVMTPKAVAIEEITDEEIGGGAVVGEEILLEDA